MFEKVLPYQEWTFFVNPETNKTKPNAKHHPNMRTIIKKPKQIQELNMKPKQSAQF